jgi:phage regulator Rha-like protein
LLVYAAFQTNAARIFTMNFVVYFLLLYSNTSKQFGMDGDEKRKLMVEEENE